MYCEAWVLWYSVWGVWPCAWVPVRGRNPLCASLAAPDRGWGPLPPAAGAGLAGAGLRLEGASANRRAEQKQHKNGHVVTKSRPEGRTLLRDAFFYEVFSCVGPPAGGCPFLGAACTGGPGRAHSPCPGRRTARRPWARSRPAASGGSTPAWATAERIWAHSHFGSNGNGSVYGHGGDDGHGHCHGHPHGH